MLKEHDVDFVYREYTKEPLSVQELTELFETLGVGPRALLRSRDAKRLELTSDLDDSGLLEAMAEHPRLLQRPILVGGGKAAVGRPIQDMLGIL